MAILMLKAEQCSCKDFSAYLRLYIVDWVLPVCVSLLFPHSRCSVGLILSLPFAINVSGLRKTIGTEVSSQTGWQCCSTVIWVVSTSL